MEHPIRLAPALEAAHHCGDQPQESGEVAVVRDEQSSELKEELAATTRFRDECNVRSLRF
jgi:hypothetical protein